MADVDADGDMDLLVGDADGEITLYIRDEDGELSSAGKVEVDGEVISLSRAAPQTVDWDLDGDLDLLVGTFGGTINLYINSGSPENFVLSSCITLESGNGEINNGADSSPAFVDLDGDGKRDLVFGCTWGDIWFYTNIGTDNDPQFNSGTRLDDENGRIRLSGYARIDLFDWNGDGFYDIVTGLRESEIRLYINASENSAPVVTNPSPAGFVIMSNYPNPFNNSTKLVYGGLLLGSSKLEIFNPFGQTVSTMDVSLGQLEIPLDLTDYPAGNYLVRLSNAGQYSTKMITLTK
ncbi:MAG: T9SS type A sorting domain-containing protein [Calditrichaeota bacterium]|nr:T9SS type A sorting domain-containing protein [Calditrichota bacterium]MBT7788489.1 T9SS type A sorting domain-containing protein [Calditrichota bacterium]